MEVVYRALFIFGFLWFITRVTGRATLGELSTFQLLLYVTMGDLVQQAVTQQDYSVTASVLAIGVFAPEPRTSPATTSTAPTGTSPRASASTASANARRIKCSSFI